MADRKAVLINLCLNAWACKTRLRAASEPQYAADAAGAGPPGPDDRKLAASRRALFA